ncbi:MAG: hypothetical protein K0B09_13175 [Bacteroidales bacterium]|nr:hypothetical protein [Bacteroidales bacterium]
MKKFTISFFIALLVIGFSASATVHTVSNNQNSPGQFTSLQAAIDAASPGDTIYVSGSPTSYGSIDLNKQLTLIGAGYHPNNQFQFKTQVNYIYLKIFTGAPTTNPSGSKIMGFEVTNTIYCWENNINNVTVQLNKANSINLYGKTCDGWIIKNNIVQSIEGSTVNSTNILIYNNIITYYIRYFTNASVLIANNIFSRNSAATNIFSYVQYATVANNIVYGMSTAGCNYCTFNNNISYGGNQTTFEYDNNTGQNNLEGVTPQFVSAASYDFSFDNDYHLAAGSPGIGAGTDGTDIGIYGGIYAFPSGGEVPYQTSPVPPIPQVVNMNILNSVLPEGGTLQVEVEGKSQL